MSNIRLSKLQKWILKELYLRKINSLFPTTAMTRQDILSKYYGWKKTNAQELHKSIYLPKDFDVRSEEGYKTYIKKQIALSNSLKNLIQKGYVCAVGRNKENTIGYYTKTGIWKGLDYRPEFYFKIKVKDNKQLGNSQYSRCYAKIFKVKLTKKGEEIARNMAKKLTKIEKEKARNKAREIKKKKSDEKVMKTHKKLTDF